ncbi:MAG: 2-oxoacid:acceptor oxidoreductase subunit alpha [Thermodesulfobacteriota bacterium]
MTDPGGLNILIGGEAGQGLVTIGQLLAKALVRSGYFIVVTQGYQSRIRGGHNTFSIRTGPRELSTPREAVDLLIALDRETISLHQGDLHSGGLIITDLSWGGERSDFVGVPFKELGPVKLNNTLALGVAGALIGLPQDVLLNVLSGFFGKKNPSVLEENRQALTKAFQWTGNKAPVFPKLPRVSDPGKRVMMNGNEAIALGALSAGLKFFSFYPMTPATSIALSLAAQAESLGVIVEQAENEIGAVNMAIGASFAGAPSMVATSGGGFALMVEGVSLSAMTETPLVIVVAQRPGPATGLPTRTEQADLDFILHAGHGEFPRAIFTPGTIEECFYLTRQAFALAESFQGPVFILTDQFLADSYRAVSSFPIEDLPWVGPVSDPPNISFPYQRYALTEEGLSPRLIPGMTDHLVVADSDEHTEDGHLTEDLAVRKKMVDKRMTKMEGLLREASMPEYRGEPNPDVLLMTWGSTKGAVLEAAAELNKQGKRTGTLSFSQVWPLVADHFSSILEGAKEVVAVEGNAQGQFARLIRRETGFPISRRVLRYDGLPITPEYILNSLKA